MAICGARAGATLSAALALFERYGYDSFLLKQDGLYRFDYDTFGEFLTYANFVSIRRGHSPFEVQVHELL
jgi:hypothetical protein